MHGSRAKIPLEGWALAGGWRLAAASPAVIIRKSSLCNRSDDGVKTQAVLMSVYRTLRLRGQVPTRTIATALRQLCSNTKATIAARYRVACVLATCAFVSLWNVRAASAVTRKADPTVQIAYQLQDADKAVRQKALAEIADRVHAHPGACAQPMAYRWIKPMHRAGFDKEIADWSLKALLGTRAQQPEAVAEYLLEGRIRALLALGRNDEALAAAKSLFDIIRPQRAHLAVMLIAKCLAAGAKLGGAVTQPTSNVSSVGNQPHSPSPQAIKAISVDANLYKQWIDEENGGNFVSLYRRGNRLLIADRPSDARQDLLAALKLATNQDQAEHVQSLIARTLRAEDGSFERETAYLRAHPAGDVKVSR